MNSISYQKKLENTLVYPPEYGVDTKFPPIPYWMQSYSLAIENGTYGRWEVTISEKYKNGFVDIDLGTFLIPFTRPATIDGTPASDWIYDGVEEGSSGNRICYARFVGEPKSKNGSFIFRFLVVPYNVFQTMNEAEIINYIGNTSSNILKIGSRVRDITGIPKTKRLDVTILSDGTNITNISILMRDIYVSII